MVLPLRFCPNAPIPAEAHDLKYVNCRPEWAIIAHSVV